MPMSHFIKPYEREELQDLLGYKFKRLYRLERALTCNKPQNITNVLHQDVYGTLGDALLKTVLVEQIMEKGINTKGEITIIKEGLEKNKELSGYANHLELGDYLRYMDGRRKGWKRTIKIMATTFEALIGAVYIDGSFLSAKRAVRLMYLKCGNPYDLFD